MLDLHLDLEELRRIKRRKMELCDRLRKLDFDSSGLISMESFLQIGEKYDLKLSPSD